MTTDLQAAIARLTADEYLMDILRSGIVGNVASELAAVRRRADLVILAEATLDARPITAEGFVLHGTEWRHVATNLRVSPFNLDEPTIRGVWGVGDTYRNTIPEELWPQTHGDLATLMLRLERGSG